MSALLEFNKRRNAVGHAEHYMTESLKCNEQPLITSRGRSAAAVPTPQPSSKTRTDLSLEPRPTSASTSSSPSPSTILTPTLTSKSSRTHSLPPQSRRPLPNVKPQLIKALLAPKQNSSVTSMSNLTSSTHTTVKASPPTLSNNSNGNEAASKLAEALDDFLGDVERKFKGISEEILARLDEMAERCDRLEGELLRREPGDVGAADALSATTGGGKTDGIKS